jgi:tetratricopeptide (TPR) repeat protein
MNFNPFRSADQSSSGSTPAAQTQNTTEAAVKINRDNSNLNDSWHTNAPLTPQRNRGTAPAPASAPLSWFSSWTSSATVTASNATSSAAVSSSYSNATVIQPAEVVISSKHETIQTTTTLASPSNNNELPRSPSSFNMLRGVEYHETEDTNHYVSNTTHYRNNHTVVKQESFSARMKNVFIGPNTTGCMPATTAINTSLPSNNDHAENDDLYSIIADVPFFPPEHCEEKDTKKLQPYHKQQQQQHREEELVVEFPSRQNATTSASNTTHQTLLVQTSTTTSTTTTSVDSNKQHNSSEDQSETFPGFALYTMARAFYVLGQYTKALDMTTECLAFQKKALLISNDGNNNYLNHLSTTTNNNSMNETSPAFGGVRNYLKGGSGIGGKSTTIMPTTQSPIVPNAHHPIVIANNTAKMLSNYPTHTCVAQTMLLRARVLAVCGLYGYGDDENEMSSGDVALVHQAVQNVELAVAIQRKISTFTHVNIDLTQWKLATPLILLGVLKMEIYRFDEAENAYEEALLILRSVRQLHCNESTSAADRGDEEMTRQHDKISKRITREMAQVYYLKGRSFQCRRQYRDAFDCYNKGLGLFKNAGASKYSRVGSRRIVRCMKRSSALERLLSEYWDDPARI